MGGAYIPREDTSHPTEDSKLQNQIQPSEPSSPDLEPLPQHADSEPAHEPVEEPLSPPEDEYLTMDEPSGPEPAPPAQQGATTEDYVPDLTFKVMDQTYQFDERLTPLIKDKETEEYFREMAQRAYGLDYVKDDRTALRTENQQLMQFREKFAPVKTDLDFAMDRLKAQDFESFKDVFGITDEMVFNYARTKARLADPETPEEFKWTYQQNRQNAQANYDLYHQNRQLYAQSGQAAPNIAAELEQTLQDPNVAHFAQEWDARAGQQGAFRQEIINRGKLHHMEHKQDIMPQQIVQQLTSQYPAPAGQYQPQYRPLPPLVPFQQNGHQQFNGGTPPPQQPPTIAAVPSRQAPQGRPPVIPHTPGSGSSPVRRQVRSIEDIRKLANEAN